MRRKFSGPFDLIKFTFAFSFKEFLFARFNFGLPNLFFTFIVLFFLATGLAFFLVGFSFSS